MDNNRLSENIIQYWGMQTQVHVLNYAPPLNGGIDMTSFNVSERIRLTATSFPCFCFFPFVVGIMSESPLVTSQVNSKTHQFNKWPQVGFGLHSTSCMCSRARLPSTFRTVFSRPLVAWSKQRWKYYSVLRQYTVCPETPSNYFSMRRIFDGRIIIGYGGNKDDRAFLIFYCKC